MSTITLAIIAKHSSLTFRALVDAALPHVTHVVVALDDGAEVGIEGYLAPPVEYFHRSLAKDFSAQRNFLIAQAKGQWVLHLDTDEQLLPWMWDHIADICRETQEDLIMLPRANRYVEKIEETVSWPDWQPKLHRNNGVRFQNPVHEWPVRFNGARFLPAELRYAIQHTKTYALQDAANRLYATIPPIQNPL